MSVVRYEYFDGRNAATENSQMSNFSCKPLFYMLFSYICTIAVEYRGQGDNYMVQEAFEGTGTPQRGTLLRRAHELLESFGRPTAEDLLIQHLFGAGEG